MRLLFVVGLIAASAASAAPETLSSSGIAHGGFGGPTVSLSQFAGRPALLTGGRGGWLIDHRLVLGAAVQGTPYLFGMSASGTAGTQLWHGGALVEYLFAPERVLHASASLTLGAAWVRHRAQGATAFENAVAFAVEPQLGAELNVTSFFRIGLAVGYRFVGDPGVEELRPSDLGGFTGSLQFRFGAF